MSVKQAWGAGVIGLICLIIGLFVKTNQLRQEAEMRTLMVPVEVTDTQYLALESISLYDAQQAAQIIANEAVTSKADAQIKSFGSEANFLITEAEEAISDATASHWESEKAVQDVYDAMPRTESFVAAEIADVEAKILFDQIAQQKANERRNEESPYGCLTKERGVFIGPSGREKYYNLPMGTVVNNMRAMGYGEAEYPVWVREDGVRMFGPFVMIAANTYERPKGTILDTSLGEAIVVDHCVAAETDTGLIDVAVTW